MNPPAEEHFGLKKASQMDLFERIVDVLNKLTLLFFSKNSRDTCRA